MNTVLNQTPNRAYAPQAPSMSQRLRQVADLLEQQETIGIQVSQLLSGANIFVDAQSAFQPGFQPGYAPVPPQQHQQPMSQASQPQQAMHAPRRVGRPPRAHTPVINAPAPARESKRNLTPEARARISAAQQKRWANYRAEQGSESRRGGARRGRRPIGAEIPPAPAVTTQAAAAPVAPMAAPAPVPLVAVPATQLTQAPGLAPQVVPVVPPVAAQQ